MIGGVWDKNRKREKGNEKDKNGNSRRIWPGFVGISFVKVADQFLGMG
jgi:hypothetical protein